MPKPLIDAKVLREIFDDCLFRKEELDEKDQPKEGIPWIKVEGVLSSFGICTERLKKHESQIVEYLKNTPTAFHKGVGGGWSFLNLCCDKNETLWGQHSNVEQLIVLGIAIGKVSFPLPRKIWTSLPGGVPYVVIDVADKQEKK